MKEIKADLFSFLDDEETDAICITTNGIVKKDGLAVMGAGVALEAAKRFPKAQEILGLMLRQTGKNRLWPIGLIDKDKICHAPSLEKVAKKDYKKLILSFPTKQHWKDPSIPELIKESAENLVSFSNQFGLSKVILPPPGISNGKLDWENDVKPILKGILDDRFIVTFWP